MKKIAYPSLIVIASALILGTAVQAQNSPKAGIDLNDMDRKVKPGDDFYRFVNGSWLDKTQIPSDKTSWGTMTEIYENTNKEVAKILKEATASGKYASNTDQGKAINLYTSVMDTLTRNKQGIDPIKPYLAKIDAVKNLQDLQTLITEMEPLGGIGFFAMYIGADDKDSNKNSVNIAPGKLGLPDRDYYIADDKESKDKRAKYVLHLTRMLGFLNPDMKANSVAAEKILALETAMSQPRLDRVERRDSRKQYNPMTVTELQKLTPAINWNAYFTALGITNLNSVIVTQPRYMTALHNILTENQLDAWKAYMRWVILNRTAGQLSDAIAEANFDFYGKTLNGIQKRRPLDERALQTVNSSIGQALGKLYVEKMFPAEAKNKAESMIKNIITAYKTRIDNLSWMSAATKVKAQEKIDKMIIKVGYPDNWKDYSKLQITAASEGGSFFENSNNLARWNFNNQIDKLNKPVDKTEWFMAPQTVNAYYNPSYNEIVFPAAILQAPMYDYRVDEALNYGAIGAVIGHEISHGFDDSGSRYNAQGNLSDWWTEEDLKKFTELGGALADQYSALEPYPGVHVDGKFTLGENIGDLGGVNAAYDGLQLYLKSSKNPGLIDGYTPEQRFFISWTRAWRAKTREESIKTQVKTDPHSPDQYRGYVPLQNIDAFYKAFDIKKGDKLYLEPSKRVKIW
ncbi:M13 family metallopeptidase [Flavobacterium sp. CYK-4]|uniref:M13 family metallopeptidase n=1 Tax=Flavobacterium lotistagni TaxID=2709660 RepID=UPI00140A9D1A|nr:M13 family metallopeptidase [Flavobacterium lotistagni]NHM07829.1 M13 family metallopeptidase [Flavobacterium lotistagni]